MGKIYPQTHVLTNLIQLSQTKLSDDYFKLLIKIGTFYNFRYQLSKKTRERIQQQLIEINDNTHGIPTMAREIGTGDWNKVEELYLTLIHCMCPELFAIYNEVDDNLKKPIFKLI